MRERWRWAVAVAACVALARGGAWAADSTAVTIEGCPTAMTTAVRGHIALELRDFGEGPRAPASGDRISIACDGGTARIRVRGSDDGAEIGRIVELGSFPADAAPRAVALAAIEALAALTRQRAAAKAPAAETPRRAPVPVVAAARPPAPAAAPARPVTVLALSGAWRSFLADAGLSLWGAALELDRDVGRRFDLGADLEVVGGGQSQIGFGETTGLAASARGSFGVRGGGRALRGIVSLGGRLGVARLAGVPAAGSTTVTGDELVRPWGGPVLSAAVTGARGRVGVRVGAEVGYAAIAAQGLADVDGAVVVAMRGPWVNVTLGVGMLP